MQALGKKMAPEEPNKIDRSFIRVDAEKLTLDEVHQINQEVFYRTQPIDDENELMRKASILMTGGQFQDAIELYLELIKKFPDNKNLYLSQVGAGYYFLGEYEKAIDYYLEALKQGFVREMIDDNIWESCEMLYKRDRNSAVLKRYLEIFPEGKYSKQVNELLTKTN